MPANGGQGITKGSFFFDVPTVLADRQVSWVEHLCHDGHQAKETKETRRGTFDGTIRPLTLGFKAEESTQFFEGDFDIPAQREPDDNLFSRNVRIGAKESSGFEAIFWAAH